MYQRKVKVKAELSVVCEELFPTYEELGEAVKRCLTATVLDAAKPRSMNKEDRGLWVRGIMVGSTEVVEG